MKIQTGHLYKKFGKKQVLTDINLELENGLYGLLGENGAGKSTLMKILATVLQKSKGTVTIGGIPIENVAEVRKRIGYMPQEFSFYPGFTVFEILEYFAALSCAHLEKSDLLEILEKVHLLQEKDKKAGKLSGGMKRRLGIAAAIVHSPEVLLVDEPTVGLDPQERMNFKNLLVELAEGRTVLLSTHIISDVEDICENLVVLKKGTVIYEGKKDPLVEKLQGRVWEFAGDVKETEWLEEQGIEIVARKIAYNRNVVRFLSDVPVKNASQAVQPGLEDAYIGLIKGKIQL